MHAVIRTEQLSKRYGQHLALDQLNLEVGEGEVFGFLGPNGAGKTTTIAMLLGLVKPSGGRAVVLGHDVQQQPAAALRQVGAMAETAAFYPYLSGRDNLRALALTGGLPLERVDQALSTVGLSEQARKRFRSYSLGMRQRLGIAAALLPDPQLVLLDEPTNGLDPAGQQDIRDLIRTLAGGGRTVFLCSHQLNEVEQLCGRVAILKTGRVIAQGNVAELLGRGNGLHVQVAGDRDHAADVLRSVEWIDSVTPHGEGLLLGTAAERAADVTMLLANHAIAVTEIRAHQRRLEDFFLDVTR